MDAENHKWTGLIANPYLMNRRLKPAHRQNHGSAVM
jgi:hypothetical protein